MKQPDPPHLVRGIGPWQATALNVANMIGVGPFITIPLFLQTFTITSATTTSAIWAKRCAIPAARFRGR